MSTGAAAAWNADEGAGHAGGQMGERQLRVFLVDDHDVVRDGLRHLLEAEQDIVVVGEAATVSQARQLLLAAHPDVVVVDYRLPDGDGVEIVRWARGERGDLEILMLTSYDEDDVIVAAIAAEVRGVLLKQVRSRDIVDAVRKVALGQSVLHPLVAQRLMRRLGARDGSPAEVAAAPLPSVEALTGQERNVLRAIGEGMSNRQIADRLGVTEKTVKNHVTRMLGKLGLQRRTQAAVLAARYPDL